MSTPQQLSREHKQFLIKAEAAQVIDPRHVLRGKWEIRVSVLNQRREPPQSEPLAIALPEKHADDAEVGMQKAIEYVVTLIECKDPTIPW